MKRKGTATLDGNTPVDLLHHQVNVTPAGTLDKWFIRFAKGGTGWVDTDRLTDIQEDTDGEHTH